MRIVFTWLVVCVGVGVAGPDARSVAGETTITTVRVASGLEGPLYVTFAPEDSTRLFIVEQSGRIRVLRDGSLLVSPFLDLADISLCCGERGLLGLAFHPQYQSNGFFFVNYTDNLGDTVVARYSVSDNPDVADPLSQQVVLQFDQPSTNHNGGWLAFGPDGYLYIANGDGGGSTDVEDRAQDTTDQWLGKILRIDVNQDEWPSDLIRNYGIPPSNPFVGQSGDDEIWALGLRNPWRCAFDSVSGDLYIADVGERTWEEIDFQDAQSLGKENYGWHCMEASACSPGTGCVCQDTSLTLPIHEYVHGGVPYRCSITGGEVYRGCAIPELTGAYFFADFCSHEIWSLRQLDGAIEVLNRTAELAPGGDLDIASISSFGRDAQGELYICDLGDGEVFKIVPADVSTHASITHSIPPDGSIDARQPSQPDGSGLGGWRELVLTFDQPSRCPATWDYWVTQDGGSLPAPVVESIAAPTADTVVVRLNRAIEPGAWTTLVHVPSGSAVRLGWLPGDVNANGTSNAADILSLIDALNGAIDPLPYWSTDVDRSGLTGSADILRVIDLLNGANVYDVYIGATLP